MRPLAFALVTVLALACSSKSRGPDPDDQERDGEVIEVEGEVTAQRGGSADVRKLALHAQVFGNDTITTAEAASVKIRLLHNDAVIDLAGSMKRRLSKTAAWRAEKGKAGVFDEANDTQSAAAGRHAEKQGADTRATADKDMAVKKTGHRQPIESTADRTAEHMSAPDDPGSKGPGGGGDAKTRLDRSIGPGLKAANDPKSRVTYRSAATKLDAEADNASMVAFNEKLEKAYSSGIRACHERALASKPDASGTVSIELDLGKDGSVIEARLKGFDEEISACILAKAKTWSFEPMKDENGAPVATTLRFSIVLKPE